MSRFVKDVVMGIPSLYGDNRLFYTQLDAINNLTRYIGDETDLDNDTFQIEAGNLMANLRKPGYRYVVQLSREPSVCMAAMMQGGATSANICVYLQSLVGFITNLSNEEIVDKIKGTGTPVFSKGDFEKIGVFCEAAQERLKSAWKEYFPTLNIMPPMKHTVWSIVDDVLSRPTAYPAIGRLCVGLNSQSAQFQFICGMCLAALHCRPSTSVTEVYGR